MVRKEQIRQYAHNVAEAFHPEKIVLFGSYAKGTASEDSDVDLLVIMRARTTSKQRPSLAIRRRFHAGFPMDILVRTPETVARRLKMGDCFLREILETGEVLYAADHA